MTRILLVLSLALVISLVNGYPTDIDPQILEDSKVHVFVLLVPDKTVRDLRKARQEEGVEITETGAYVGQIISGVLGGDVRPIFAGSASFIDEPDVQQGVSTILANVAPSLNMFFKGWFNRFQTALGITTMRPLNATAPNGQQPGQLGGQQQLGQPFNGAPQGPQPGQPGGVPLQGQTQQSNQAQQIQIEGQSQEQVGEMQKGVYTSGDHLFESTTVEPLPLLKLKPEEDDDENDNIQRQKLH